MIKNDGNETKMTKIFISSNMLSRFDLQTPIDLKSSLRYHIFDSEFSSKYLKAKKFLKNIKSITNEETKEGNE